MVVGFASSGVADVGTRLDFFPTRCPFMVWTHPATYQPLQPTHTMLRIGSVPSRTLPRWFYVL